MEITQQYKDRVSLLLDILPIVAKRKCFALKGGTALNLFIWEMPRLSVDDEFGKFAAISVLNKAEIYGGKICAALDRQHPRDIFDVSKILDEGKGDFNEKIKEAFMFYLLSHNRPINEILFSRINDKKADFKNQFEGMAKEKFDYEDFIKISKLLREKISNLFSDNDKKFILSFKRGKPEWSLFVKDISQFPSIKWKLANINNLIDSNPAKYREMYDKLERVWE
jgi:hypothetical protein